MMFDGVFPARAVGRDQMDAAPARRGGHTQRCYLVGMRCVMCAVDVR